MTALRWINDVLAFVLELAALAALVVWGFAVGPNLLLRIVFGVGAAAMMIAVWGNWLAPRARHPLPRPGVFAGKLIVLLLAAAALWAAGHAWLGAALGVLAVINLSLWWAMGSAAEPARRSRG
ncbi:MAG: YrdB family protein [Nakamurella sp.]